MNPPPPLPQGLRQIDTRGIAGAPPPVAQKEEQTFVAGLPVETILYIAIGTILYLIYGIGAYRLSYNTNGSVFLGIVAFLLAPLYYPYYGLFVSQPQQAPLLMGGRRRKH